MANLKVSLHAVTKEIAKAIKELRAVRKKASPQAKKQIDVDIRNLQATAKKVRHICLEGVHGLFFQPPPKKK